MTKKSIISGIAVSGSRDRTAIIWDLSRWKYNCAFVKFNDLFERWTYIKNLPGHVGPVAAVNINELTGTESLTSIYIQSLDIM